MQYCSLDDAFLDIGGAPSPGCSTQDSAARAARKEERRRARKCRGPPAGFLDIEKDPDRQQLNPMPEVPAMNPATGVKETFIANAWLHSHEQPKYPTDAGSPQYDKDELDAYVKNEEREHVMVVPIAGNMVAKPKRFFGASSPEEEPYADYVPDQKEYTLQPDFMKAFEVAGVARAGSTAAGLPTPSVNQYWKPLTPAGAQTSFVEHLPPPGGEQVVRSQKLRDDPDMKEMMRRMDTLFARLDDLNGSASPEQITSELLMFISSGIFIIFMMDLLVKKGSRMRF